MTYHEYVLRSEIEQLQNKLNRQSEHLAQALKEKNDAVRLESRAIATYHAIQVDNAKLRTTIESQDREIAQLKDELGNLRPPEPKFKLNQVVKKLGDHNAFTIHQRQYKQDSWWYSNQRVAHVDKWYRESQFRKLTPEEIG